MRKEGIISPSRLLIRSGPHARGSSRTRVAEINMADEAKDPGAISKPGIQPGSTGAPTQPQSEPEVQILEEHVTRAAQKPVPPPAPPPPPVIKSVVTPAPRPAAPVPPPPTTPSVPAPKPVPPAAPVKPAPAPVAPPPPPPPAVEPPPAPKPVATPTPVPPAAAPARDAAPLPPASPALGTDIAKILSAVKLPERRDTVLPGEKKVQVESKKFDTSIAGSALDDGPAVDCVQSENITLESGLSRRRPQGAQGRGGDPGCAAALKPDIRHRFRLARASHPRQWCTIWRPFYNEPTKSASADGFGILYTFCGAKHFTLARRTFPFGAQTRARSGPYHIAGNTRLHHAYYSGHL